MKDPKARKQFFNGIIFLVVAVFLMLRFKSGMSLIPAILAVVSVAGAIFSFFKFSKLKKALTISGRNAEEDAR